jgi:hypothetical protein
MSNKKYPKDILKQTQTAVEAWKRVDPAFKVGDLTPDQLTAGLAKAASIQAEIDSLETRLTELRNQRDDTFNWFWDALKRLRSAIKGIYGDNSTQYEMIGGKRLADRKPVARKAATPKS